MPLKKNRRFKKLKKFLDENKNENNVTHTNAQQNENVIETKKGIENNLSLIEKDQLNTQQASTPLCKIPANETIFSRSATCSKKCKSSAPKSSFNISNSDISTTNETVRSASATKTSSDEDRCSEHLKYSTATNIDPMFNHPILEGVYIPVTKKTIYDLNNTTVNVTKTLNVNVKHLDHHISTNIVTEDVTENPILENRNEPMAKTTKYDISVYDYDEEDASDELQRINAVTKCKICSFIAETPIDLLKHKRDNHKVERIILPMHEIRKYFDYPDRTSCPICKQPIKSRNFRSIFIKHLLVHTIGFYECRICKKKFRRLDHMRAHEKRHVLTYAELRAMEDTYAELRAMEDTIDNNPVEFLNKHVRNV